jgi:hypothetical protein
MKKNILIPMCLLLAFVTDANANDYQDRIVGIAVVSVADLYFSDKLGFGDGRHEELNVVLPSDASVGEMIAFGVTGLVGLYGVDRIFPGDHLAKDILWDSTEATLKYAVNENMRMVSGFKKKNNAFILIFSFEI